MTRRRQVEKKDANHNEIVDALRSIGAFVFETAGVGGGFPDLFVLCPNGGGPWLLEIKDGKKPPSERKLTSAQVKFHADVSRYYWYQLRVVTSVDEALALFNAKATA